LQKNIKNVSETEQEVEIILSAEEFGPEYNQELEEAKRTIQIKGFRKGHAPAGLIKKLAGPSIEATVAEKMASKYFGEIIDAEKIKPSNRAELIDFTFTPDLLTIRLSYEIHPEFELKDYSEYTFTKANYTVTDEEVAREINLILKGHGSLVTVEEAALATDTVIGDVSRLNDAGEPEEEDITKNHHFTLEYLPEENPFRSALTGKKAGDTVDVTADPKDADTEPTTFRVSISEVKRLELPELTDELVNEITRGRFESVNDFTSDVRIQITEHFTAKSDEDLLESISAKLIEENPVPTPKSMVESFSKMLVENAKRQMGGSFPKSFDESQFRLAMVPNAEKHARWLLISQKIAELAELAVTDEDIKAYADREAEKSESANAEDLHNTYLSAEFRDYITDTILKEKIYEIIKSKVTITEEETAIPSRNS
jgi:trigger factor